MAYKFQQKLQLLGIADLNDEVLHPDFVKSANEFLEFATNPESSKEQIEVSDNDLCAMFDEMHTVENSESATDGDVAAKREDAKTKARLDDYKAKLDKLEKENIALKQAEQSRAERERKDAEAKAEADRIAAENKAKEEADAAEAKRLQDEQARIANEAQEQNASEVQKKIDMLLEAGAVSFEDLEDLNFVNKNEIGLPKIKAHGLLFKKHAFTRN